MTQTPRESDPSNPVTAPQHGTAGAGGYAEDSYSPRAPADGAVLVPDREAETAGPAAGAEPHQVTRAGMVWAAVASALVVLIVLIAFILQNQDYVRVKFFGLEGDVAQGIALFIAAVGGGVLVAIAGAVRIIQLRLAAHRQRVKPRGRR
ncbi:DUF1049 domain-containing protein [Arthrobacter sp. UYCu712]|uniref:LapA family protein n=1 Tax=Arthrobacter sp. UYCu712 TaxID=3156340 RepID=UPI0033923015